MSAVSFLKADAKPLAVAISKVLPVVARISKAPILTQVLLSAADGKLIVRGTDLDIEVEATVAAETFGEASIAVNPRILQRLLRSVSGEVVTLSLDDEDARLTVSWSDGRAALTTMPAADFPDFSVPESAFSAQLPPTFVSEVLDPVRHCISTEETRYYLNGIVIDRDNDGRAVLLATDGHRMRAAPAPTLEAMIEATGHKRPIVRRDFVSLWRDAAFGKPATFTLFKREDACTHCALETEGLKITGKLIDGRFPDWQKVVPAGAEHVITFNRAAILMAVQRIALITGARPSHSHNVTITFADGGAKLTTRAMQVGEIECAVPCEGSAPEPMGFNVAYLVSAIERARGPMVTLAAKSQPDPVLISGSEDPAGTAMILMQLRTETYASAQYRRAA